jgi:hypothetical protein
MVDRSRTVDGHRNRSTLGSAQIKTRIEFFAASSNSSTLDTLSIANFAVNIRSVVGVIRRKV